MENINALDEVNKGACMGMDAVKYLLDKVEDSSLEKLLNKSYNDYKEISDEVEILYDKYNSDREPNETGMMTKAMTWSGVEMKTMTDKSNSKIAEIMLQGVNMGVIEGRKLLNNKKVDEDVYDIISKFVAMQERLVEDLKKYL
ncbi:MAG: hypothetical protein E7160_05235 [Firmicutes bacterium]|nr:hypothetical protein [Bacillota bacterium]